MTMNILHINAPTNLAGAERVLLNYLSSYDPDHFTLHVASYVNYQRQDNSFTTEIEKLGISFHKVLISSSNYLVVLKETRELIRKLQIDLVHSHGYRSDITGYIATRSTGTPIVSTVHGWTPISAKLRCYEMLDRWFLRRFNGIIGVSKEIVKSLHAAGIRPEKVRLINNAVPPRPEIHDSRMDIRKALFSCAADEKILLAVGRLSWEKGLDILLRSFQMHCAGDQRIRLVLVGEGPARDTLVGLAEELGISARVIFAGHINKVAPYYAAADLLVLSSRTEGLPMVILEAMQAELPVVCTRVGGIPELIADGETGIMVEPEDADALGRAIMRVLGDQALSDTMRRKGVSVVRTNFSADAWARKIEQFYMDVYKPPYE
jgi:glycosyltransferase involved in cell wall biosynthesis